MKAMLVPVDGLPITIEVDGLGGLQAAVGGYIEPCSWIFDDKPAVYVNEEGKLACEPNRAVYATAEDARNLSALGGNVEEGCVLDILYGDFVCVGFDPNTGESRDISDNEIAKVKERFGTLQSVESGWIESLRIRLARRAKRR